MTSILGISAFYHDSAAAMVIDGEVIAAVQEERFSRTKHDSGYPFNAVNYVLSQSKLKLSEVDYITFYEKPFLKFERLLETYVAFAPRGFKSFSMSMPLWLREKLFQKKVLFNELQKHDYHLLQRPSLLLITKADLTPDQIPKLEEHQEDIPELLIQYLPY